MLFIFHRRKIVALIDQEVEAVTSTLTVATGGGGAFVEEALVIGGGSRCNNVQPRGGAGDTTRNRTVGLREMIKLEEEIMKAVAVALAVTTTVAGGDTKGVRDGGIISGNFVYGDCEADGGAKLKLKPRVDSCWPLPTIVLGQFGMWPKWAAFRIIIL